MNMPYLYTIDSQNACVTTTNDCTARNYKLGKHKALMCHARFFTEITSTMTKTIKHLAINLKSMRQFALSFLY